MNDDKALEIVNKIFINIFNKNNPNDLNTLLEKFAFDIKLPKEVKDSTTNEITWTDCINNHQFITQNNMDKKDQTEGWMLEKQDIKDLQDIIKIWNSINLTTTERIYDSINVSKSDTIYRSENVYHCTDCYDCKNIIYCDSCNACEFVLASQRSGTCNFCIRTDDSKDCSNSYNVLYSNKVSNSLFIQDCYDLHECMFCSHIASKKYCIANMQFEKDEYYIIKDAIIEWIINS